MKEFFNAVFRNFINFKYVRRNITVMCMFLVASFAFAQQTLRITGTVSDEVGIFLPGVNIQIEGTNLGTSTDIEGKYSIDIPRAGVTLIFSYLGFTTRSIMVTDQRVINVKLTDDTQTLDEIVVVGYSTMKKSDLTGSVSVVKVTDIKD